MGHNLNDTWVLWFHNPVDCNWGIDSYKKITEISTVEDFWKLNEVINEDHVINSMLFFMRDGINPMWEDKKNIDGGCFSYKISNKFVVNAWTNLSYTLIGYSLSKNKKFEDNITGITISPKKNFCVIKIWASSCEFKDPNLISKIDNLSNEDCIFRKHN